MNIFFINPDRQLDGSISPPKTCKEQVHILIKVIWIIVIEKTFTGPYKPLLNQ